MLLSLEHSGEGGEAEALIGQHRVLRSDVINAECSIEAFDLMLQINKQFQAWVKRVQTDVWERDYS